jgi:hypothetical protein
MRDYMKFNAASRVLVVKDKGRHLAYKIDAILSSDGLNYLNLKNNGYYYVPHLKSFVTTGRAQGGGCDAKTMVVDKITRTLGFRIKSEKEAGMARQIKISFDTLLDEARKYWD